MFKFWKKREYEKVTVVDEVVQDTEVFEPVESEELRQVKLFLDTFGNEGSVPTDYRDKQELVDCINEFEEQMFKVSRNSNLIDKLEESKYRNITQEFIVLFLSSFKNYNFDYYTDRSYESCRSLINKERVLSTFEELDLEFVLENLDLFSCTYYDLAYLRYIKVNKPFDINDVIKGLIKQNKVERQNAGYLLNKPNLDKEVEYMLYKYMQIEDLFTSTRAKAGDALTVEYLTEKYSKEEIINFLSNHIFPSRIELLEDLADFVKNEIKQGSEANKFWFNLSSISTLSLDFIKNNKDKVYWGNILKVNRNLTDEFIRVHYEYAQTGYLMQNNEMCESISMQIPIH